MVEHYIGIFKYEIDDELIECNAHIIIDLEGVVSGSIYLGEEDGPFKTIEGTQHYIGNKTRLNITINPLDPENYAAIENLVTKNSVDEDSRGLYHGYWKPQPIEVAISEPDEEGYYDVLEFVPEVETAIPLTLELKRIYEKGSRD